MQKGAYQMVMDLEWNRLPVLRRCFSPLHSNTLMRSAPDTVAIHETKDDSSTTAKTAIALCALGSVISMDEWTEYLGGCGFISQVEYAKLRDLDV